MEAPWRSRGYVTVEELERLGLIPPRERMERGPVAVAECPEPIPCNICVSACPFKAVSMEGITGLPRIDWERCTGCGVCVTACPGQAVFVVDLSRGPVAHVTLPYEMLPEPRPGMEATLLGRDGRPLGRGRVVRAWRRGGTWAVTVEAPRDKAMEVRAIRLEERSQG